MIWEPVEILVRKSRECLEARNYFACAEIARHILQLDPENAEATALLQQARREEDDHLQAELAAHNESLRHEAQLHFQAGNYVECLPILNFLHELEPQDKSVQDQMELCLGKLRGVGLDTANVLSPSIISNEDTASPECANGVNMLSQSAGLSEATANEESLGEPLPSEEELAAARNRNSSGAMVFKELSAQISGWVLALQNPEVRKLWLIRGGAAAAILFSLFILIRLLSFGLRIKSVETSFAVLGVSSTPTGAQVFINGVPRGETNLRIDPIVPGNYEIKIEKSGFVPIVRYLPVNKGENANLSIQLEPTRKSGAEEVDSNLAEQDQIRTLFLQGKLTEANHACERILAADPRNEFALQLRRAMRDQLLSKIRPEVQLQQWPDALVNLKLALKIAPDDLELRTLWAQLPDKIKKGTDLPNSEIRPDNRKAQALHRQLRKAIGPRIIFPPSTENAFDLLGKLQMMSLADPCYL